MARYKFIGKQLREVIREARAAAKNGHREICGLLIDNGCCLELIRVRNRARRPGRFIFDTRHARALEEAIDLLGREIAGTWHSHPIATARPGPGDIAGAMDGHLMLVIDCIGREAKPWRIEKNKARALSFDAIGV